MSKEKFYISTAINYTNGSPHFGHAYEAVSADFFARFHRIAGRDVFFMTGTDEHGQKVAEAAAKHDPPLSPIQLCDKYVAQFKTLNNLLTIKEDFYIRTSQPAHEEVCRWLWKRAAAAGDIYLGSYEGWYSTREEKFLTETEAQALNYMDGDKPLIKTKEPSYFFRLSKYHDQLLAHIRNNEDFIFPPERRNEILERLKEPLHDLSISRTTFDWGVSIPEEFENKPADVKEKHVMYVWFDALTNYISGVNYPDGERARYWPADVHLIGKDIVWFHSVIWPCMLFSAGIPLPKRIVCHGFVNAPDGRKMSKSWGNVVDPMELLKTYSSDNLRYFMLREGHFGSDFSYSEDSLKERHDAEMAANVGNLVQRALNLANSYSEGKVPSESATILFDLGELFNRIDGFVKTYSVDEAVAHIFEAFAVVNKWVADVAPWHLKGDEHASRRREIVRTLLEALYALAHFAAPIMPTAIDELFQRLGTPPKTIPEIVAAQWNALAVGTEVRQGDPLFARIGENRFEKKQKKGGEAAPKKPAAATREIDVSRADLRVGKIISCEPHPTADHLYVEQIDVGEEKPRQVVSGLAKHIPIEEMRDRVIVVVCNMKPSKFRGMESHAMVIAASTSDDSKVELVSPPEGSKIGEKVFVPGYEGEPDAELNTKTKVFEKIKPDLRSNDSRVCCYKGVPLQTSAGEVLAPTLANAQLG